MATNFLELATTLKYLGAKWLPGKKVNFTPCYLSLVHCNQLSQVSFWCRCVEQLKIDWLKNKTWPLIQKIWYSLRIQKTTSNEFCQVGDYWKRIKAWKHWPMFSRFYLHILSYQLQCFQFILQNIFIFSSCRTRKKLKFHLAHRLSKLHELLAQGIPPLAQPHKFRMI